MLWNREELPAELKDKKPDEILAALKEAENAKGVVQAANDAKTQAEAAAQQAKTEIEQMKARMVELEANQKLPDPPPPDEPASPWVDPEKFVAEQTKGVNQVALNAGLLAAKMYFLQNLPPRDQKIFKKYEKDVEAVVATFTPAARVMPQSWMNAFLYAKGMHEQDIRKAESESSDFFSETPSRGAHEEPAPADKLTPEEEETCRRFHYDPVKYLANKKAATVKQSEKGAYSSYAVPTTTNRS
jgi:hypothetical protein